MPSQYGTLYQVDRATHLQSDQGSAIVPGAHPLSSPRLTESMNGLHCTFAFDQSAGQPGVSSAMSSRGRHGHLRSIKIGLH